MGLQVNMTGFMERKAAPFCSELWKYLLSAQESPVGVPKEFVEKKKEELRQKREEADKVQEELKRRRQELEEAQKATRGANRGRGSHSRSPAREDFRRVPGVLGEDGKKERGRSTKSPSRSRP